MRLNRVAHRDFIDTKFDDFGQGLVTVIFKNIKACKNTYINLLWE